jgi:hypothetical protein
MYSEQVTVAEGGILTLFSTTRRNAMGSSLDVARNASAAWYCDAEAFEIWVSQRYGT